VLGAGTVRGDGCVSGVAVSQSLARRLAEILGSPEPFDNDPVVTERPYGPAGWRVIDAHLDEPWFGRTLAKHLGQLDIDEKEPSS